MKRILTAALLAAWAGAAPYAQENPPIAPGAVPGCAWARLDPARESSTGAWGAADLQTSRLNDASTVFNIASVSKQFTALAVLLLAHDQRLDLDAPLSRHLPQLNGELGRPTLRQMLRHTSGLPDYISPLFDAGHRDKAVTVEETMKVIMRQPKLDFAPGSRFEYSNTGYFLLAQVVERVSGQSLAAFSRQAIFLPLGMRDTVIVDHYPADMSQLARGYSVQDGDVDIDESSWQQTGDGQVHTSARDMLRWLQHLDSDTSLTTPGGRRAAGVLTLLTGGAEAAADRSDRYRHGLEAVHLGSETMWAHAGGWAGYRSFMAYAPKSRRGAAVLCNNTGVDVEDMVEAVLSGRLEDGIRSADGKR